MNTYEIVYEQNGNQFSDWWNAITLNDAIHEAKEWFNKRNCKVLERETIEINKEEE